MRRLWRVPLIVVGVALFGAAPAIASKGASIDVGSIAISEQLLPGGEYRLPTFGVRNPGTEQTSYELVVSYLADQGQHQPPEAWFTFSPGTLTLAPGESQPINTSLEVPPGAEPGDYLALIGPQIVAEGEGAQVGAGAAARVTFTIGPATWLEGFIRWLWGVVLANPWLLAVVLLLVLLVVAWFLRRRFTFRVARR